MEASDARAAVASDARAAEASDARAAEAGSRVVEAEPAIGKHVSPPSSSSRSVR
jgi:hypothetical protein